MAARGQKSNSVPPAQVPQRDIIDAQMAFFGSSITADGILLAA